MSSPTSRWSARRGASMSSPTSRRSDRRGSSMSLDPPCRQADSRTTRSAVSPSGATDGHPRWFEGLNKSLPGRRQCSTWFLAVIPDLTTGVCDIRLWGKHPSNSTNHQGGSCVLIPTGHAFGSRHGTASGRSPEADGSLLSLASRRPTGRRDAFCRAQTVASRRTTSSTLARELKALMRK